MVKKENKSFEAGSDLACDVMKGQLQKRKEKERLPIFTSQ